MLELQRRIGMALSLGGDGMVWIEEMDSRRSGSRHAVKSKGMRIWNINGQLMSKVFLELCRYVVLFD